MPTQILFGQEAKSKILTGVNKLADAVSSTLGPNGQTVIISNQHGYSQVTKDGITVANGVELEDNIEATGANIVRQASAKTAEEAGDGTTTSIVLARAIAVEANKLVAAGAKPSEIKSGIDKAVKAVVEFVKSQSIKVEGDMIKQVATISANNNEEIGELLAEAYRKIGEHGTITIESSPNSTTYIETVSGMEITSGYLSHYFTKNVAAIQYELVNPKILIIDRKVSAVKDILHVLDYIISSNQDTSKPKNALLIIAEDVEGELLITLINNHIKGVIDVVAVKSPDYGERKKKILEDIACLTGATVISEEKGLSFEQIDPEVHLGSCAKAVVGSGKTTVIGGRGAKEDIQIRVNELSELLNSPDKDFVKERIAKLTGGIAVAFVGAATEVEMKEKKDRVEDAIRATKSAIEEGIVPGGGSTFIKAIKCLESVNSETEDERHGVNIIKKVLEKPLWQICENCGVNSSLIVERVKSEGVGYNAKTGEFEDLIKAGVIDPTKVVRCSIENSASAASMLITSNCLIQEIKAK